MGHSSLHQVYLVLHGLLTWKAGRGLLEEREGRWQATERGFSFLNDVVGSFLDGEKTQAAARA